MKSVFIFAGHRVYLPDGEIPKSFPEKKIHISVLQSTLDQSIELPNHKVYHSEELFQAEPQSFVSLREVLDVFDAETTQALVKGMQLSQWDRRSRHCGCCGANTLMGSLRTECDSSSALPAEEIAKNCPSCGEVHYPLIQPVAIVLVRRDRDLLLARGLPPRKHHSCLAGFVEIGEDVESCLRREVKEEVGVEIKNLQYFGSQPWPFPSNLMLAFQAEWASGELVADPKEISHAAWFSPDKPPEVLPPKISIARQMIDAVWK